MKDLRYCDHCDKETEHEVEMERDASDPPEDFIETEEAGYASQVDCTFYANGDSEWRVTCLVCYFSYIEV